MPAKPRRPNLLKVIHTLQEDGEAPPDRSGELPLDSGLARLRAWQSVRLAHTYADFLSDPRCQSACSFFLSDIYAARDFTHRDRDFEHLYVLLSRFLPASMLRLLHEAISLNQMTYDLDNQLLRVLVDELSLQDDLTPEMYAEAYRRCDNYAERRRQIERLVSIVREIGVGARHPLVGPTLRLARLPALRLGWHELYDFLERGYRAFLPIKDIRPFAGEIERREITILERIFAGDPEPFDIGAG